MNKFKVGDRVQLTCRRYSMNKGSQGTVSLYEEEYNHGITVKFDKGHPETGRKDWFIQWDDLELVEENMNQEIEVGDIINGQAYKNNEVVAVKPTYYVVFNLAEKAEGSYSEFYIQKSAAVLVSKANKQELVGYELLKDLPGIPAGTKVEKSATDEFSIFATSVQQRYFFKDKQLQDTTWFKPIYKPKEVVVKISKGREVRVNSTQVDIVGYDVLSHKQFTDIYNYTFPPTKFKDKYKFFANSIQVGCQEFTKEDITSVYTAIQGLK